MLKVDFNAMRHRATRCDQTGEWPADDLAALAAVGAMRWAIPREYGGEKLSPLDLHLCYEQISSASLAAALVLTQRDSAVQWIDASTTYPRRDQLLRELAANRVFATIGIAQLTTSRQGGPPALVATPDGDGFVLNGVIPWSTGAGKSNYVVAGAVLPDRRQILFCLPTDLPGVTIDPPLPLVALRSTWTTQVHCTGVKLDHSLLLRGPTENALAGGKKGVPFGQVFLALGLCRAAVDLIAAHQSESGARTLEAMKGELAQLRKRVLYLSTPDSKMDAVGIDAEIRADAADLAIRATHAAVTLYKGSALLADHPAQRLAREAMFLLVWSCPGAVMDCTLDRLIEC